MAGPFPTRRCKFQSTGRPKSGSAVSCARLLEHQCPLGLVTLVQAEVASTVHRFADARDHLARAASLGAPREEIDRHLLSIDQA
jgi:hypothetical protein